MRITRRQFNRAALTFSMALGAGKLLPGCGDDGDGGGGAGGQTELRTFHFDLAHLPLDQPHVLHVGGKRYPLQRHTAETLAQARRERSGLRGLPDSRVTHFAADVITNPKRVQRMHVTTTDPMRGAGLVLVAMQIPTAARLRARGARGLGDPAPTGTECTQYDQVPDDYVSGRSTAKSVITHHPDLVTVEPDVAAAIETHMDYDQAAAVDNLTMSICNQGPAYEYDPAYEDGWCVLVRLYNADGSAQLDTNGEQIFDYKFSDKTSDDMKPAIDALLGSVKNDASLDGEQYQVIYHGDPVDESALPAANPTVLNSDDPTLTGQRAQLSGDGESVSFSVTGYHHNVLFYDASHSSTERSVTLKILNLNFIWYALYLEYLDADGVPLSSANRSSFLAELVADGLDLETDTLKFWDMISAPATVFGLPVPFPYQISLDLPDGASQVRLNLIGPGAYGSLEYGPAIIAGAVMTTVICFAIPMYFLSKAVGESESLSLEALFEQKGLILKTLLLYSQLYSEATGGGTNDLGVEGSITSILASLTQDLFFNLKSTIPELWDWLIGEVAEDEAEQSVPFIGWVIRIMAILGTTGDIVASEAEICTNPMTISNTVSFTNPVTVVVSYDPADFEFPLDATHFQVQITVGAKALEPPTIVQISNEDRSKDTLTAVVENVPSTGADATVSVIFMADNGYPLAYSAAVDANGVPILDENSDRVPGDITFLNKLPASGPLIVNVPIVENPVPITAQTLYTHHHKLEYANGKYLWNYTTQPPALEPANCSTGLCDLGNVTVWVPGGMIGYSWLASSPSVRECGTNAQGQLYNFQNLSLKNDPNPARKTPGCGFPGATPLAYESTVPVGDPGNHFYLDPVRISDNDPEYHLRRITLDNTTAINVNTNESWGRFRIPIDRMAVYNKGQRPMVIGISKRFHKFAVIEVPSTPYLDDDFANNAKCMAAQGEGNDALLLNPVALTIANNGAILILQGGVNKSIKAFDFDGKPWKFFKNGTVSVLPLATDASSVTFLDISIDPTNLLYVISHAGAGTQQSDFRLDIYDANTGERVVRNTGIAVGRITVDKFRGLYSLNYETVKGSPVVEPSVSVWAPSPPS